MHVRLIKVTLDSCVAHRGKNYEIIFLQFSHPPKRSVCFALIKSKHFEKIVLNGALFSIANKSVRHNFNFEWNQICLNKSEQIKTDAKFWNWFLISFRTNMSSLIDFKYFN